MALQLISNHSLKRATISVMTLATRVIERADLLRKITSPWVHLQTIRKQAIAAINHSALTS